MNLDPFIVFIIVVVAVWLCCFLGLIYLVIR